VGIPRSGIPVAAEVARALRAPLDVIVVRKIVAAGQLSIGAVAEQGVFAVDDDALRAGRLSRRDLEIGAHHEYAELMRLIAAYRGARPLPQIAGRTVLVVDDLVATGTTARAAAGALRDLRPRRLILAAPVIAETAFATLGDCYDAIVSEIEVPGAVSAEQWYEDAAPVTDASALGLIECVRREAPAAELTPP